MNERQREGEGYGAKMNDQQTLRLEQSFGFERTNDRHFQSGQNHIFVVTEYMKEKTLEHILGEKFVKKWLCGNERENTSRPNHIACVRSYVAT